MSFEVAEGDTSYRITYHRVADAFTLPLEHGAHHCFVGNSTLERDPGDSCSTTVQGNARWKPLYFGTYCDSLGPSRVRAHLPTRQP